jgi:molecular chaperone GrpE
MSASEEESKGPRREAGPEGPRREAGPEGPRPEAAPDGPIIRDRRRIDPVTGQVRQPPSGSPGAGQSSGAGQASRGPGQARPGKHSASKPGSPRQEAAGAGPGAGQNGDSQNGGGQNGGGNGGAANTGAANTGAANTGAANTGAANSGAANSGAKAGAQSGDLAVRLAERTADLQRVQAEYANYRKRVDRDRAAVREFAVAGVLTDLLPVLDDIGRARDHDEVTGGFKAVADALESAVGKLGLSTFGEPGEVFDPNIHEALMHSYSADVTEPTCVQVLQPGYKVGERILRPARVAVAEPSDPAGARTSADEGPQAEDNKNKDSGEADAADDSKPGNGD